MQAEMNPFPTDFLPPKFAAAVRDVVAITGAPAGLVAGSALTAASLGCQATIDVQRPGVIGPCPVSLFVMTVADSGERKSAADRLFLESVIALEQGYIVAHDTALAQFEAAHAIWTATRDGLKAKLVRALRSDQSIERHQAALREHELSQPARPRHGRVLYADVTPQALLHGLVLGSGNAALHSNEAGSLVTGQSMSDVAALCSLWDGQDVCLDRIDRSRTVRVRNVRLTMGLMMQRGPFMRFCQRRDETARQSGLLARTLLSRPASTAGSRFLSFGWTPSHDGLAAFNSRVSELLQDAYEHADHRDRLAMKFDATAAREWIAAFNDAEQQLGPYGEWSEIKDFVAKAPENAARVAAIFEYFETGSQFISHQNTIRAIKIVGWYLREFQRIFGREQHLDQENNDARKLGVWLCNWSMRNPGRFSIPISTVYRSGPPSCRDAAGLARVMPWFSTRNLASIQYAPPCIPYTQPGKKPQKFILLHPDFTAHMNALRHVA